MVILGEASSGNSELTNAGWAYKKATHRFVIVLPEVDHAELLYPTKTTVYIARILHRTTVSQGIAQQFRRVLHEH